MRMEQEDSVKHRTENKEHEMQLFSMLAGMLRAPQQQWQIHVTLQSHYSSLANDTGSDMPFTE